MKIGIVTVFDSSNCGSYLQAYAMKVFLETHGHEPYFVKFRDIAARRLLFYDNGLLIRSVIKYPLVGLKRYLFAKKKFLIFNSACENTFQTICPEDLAKMDAVILGSDEIWNIRTKTFQNPLFFGRNLEKVIAYAVSAGRATPDDFFQQEFINDIANIAHVMVRDHNTQQIVNIATGRHVPCVCDPTLLLEPHQYVTAVQPSKIADDYLLIYAYDIDPWLRKHIRRYAKEHNLKIVSAGFFLIWADLNVNCSQMELYTLEQNAACVVTTTFHGSIFALLSKSKFISIPGGSIQKVEDLLDRFDLDSQLVRGSISYEEFCEILTHEIDYAAVFSKIQKYRTDSSRRLENALAEIMRQAESYNRT